MKLLNIAFDLDSTLVDLMATTEDFLMSLYGDKFAEIRSFQLKTEKDLPWDKIEHCILQGYKLWEKVPIYDGVIEFLQELYRAADNDPIRIITARPAFICANDTYKLCSRLNVPFELIITGTPETNIPGQPDVSKLNYLNRYRFFVDDRRKTALELSSSGKYVFMPEKNYNILDDEYPNLEQIKSVIDIQPRIPDFIVEV